MYGTLLLLLLLGKVRSLTRRPAIVWVESRRGGLAVSLLGTFSLDGSGSSYMEHHEWIDGSTILDMSRSTGPFVTMGGKNHSLNKLATAVLLIVTVNVSQNKPL
jgi:hypothetical protein